MTNFEDLPPELIAHVASFTNATTILSLSRTSKTIRDPSYGALVLKQIFERDQLYRARHDRLDVTLIEVVAKNDPGSWARYALANEDDEQRDQLARTKLVTSRRSPAHRFIPLAQWQAELYILLQSRPTNGFPRPNQHNPTKEKQNRNNTFSLLINEYTSRYNEPPSRYMYTTWTREASSKIFKRLCDHFAWLRFHGPEASIVPCFDAPTTTQFRLASVTASYRTPRPYDGVDAWETWYKDHVRAMLEEEITSPSEWTACYAPSLSRLFTPGDLQTLSSIRFALKRQNETGIEVERIEALRSEVVAVEAVDVKHEYPHLLNDLRITGKFTENKTGEMIFYAKVTEMENGACVKGLWKCRLTPFGLIGFWNEGLGGTPMVKKGCIWLSKKKWTE